MDGGVEDGAEGGCITREKRADVHEISLESDSNISGEEGADVHGT